MISSEYGWHDDTILDLTVTRLRIIAAAISARLDVEAELKRTLMVWQTRTLAQFIAGTVPVEKGKKNPLAAEAAKVGEGLLGEVSAEPRRADPPREPAPGSFERFMGAMGSVH